MGFIVGLTERDGVSVGYLVTVGMGAREGALVGAIVGRPVGDIVGSLVGR